MSAEPTAQTPELVPLEAHIVALQAQLERTQAILAIAGAAVLLGALVALYVGRGVRA
jgi:hypothetical protein